MQSRPVNRWLESGKRLHLQHGPIDLIIEVAAERCSKRRAYEQAHDCFNDVLDTLVGELSLLREPLHQPPRGQTMALFEMQSELVSGPVAKRMVKAALPYADTTRLSPMIAVAGSVADHVLGAMLQDNELNRVYVNNGGDIALWLAENERYTVGVCDNTETARIGSTLTLQARHQVGGVASSGWRGRSHSLGIADAVTVLARCAADADVAATLIANAVDVPDCADIERTPASELSPDSDLGDRLVTTAVGNLTAGQIDNALQNGKHLAAQLVSSNKIIAAYISLQGKRLVCGSPPTQQRQARYA